MFQGTIGKRSTNFFYGYRNLVLLFIMIFFSEKTRSFHPWNTGLDTVFRSPPPTLKTTWNFFMELVSLRKQSFNFTIMILVCFSFFSTMQMHSLVKIHNMCPNNKKIEPTRHTNSFLNIHVYGVWTLLTRVCFQTFTEAFLPLKTKLVIMFVGTFL